MLVSKEMCAFQKPVASQDELMPSSRPKQRGVVTDAKAHFARGMPAPPQCLLDFLNQFVLARCHDRIGYRQGKRWYSRLLFLRRVVTA